MPVQYRDFGSSDSARIRRVLAGVLGLISLLGCGRRSEARRHELELVVPTEIVELDPRYATRALDVKASRLVHAGLVDLHPDTLLPRPRLAQSLTLRADRSILVELKPGVRFHSGHVLEAWDVCATLEALKDAALESPHRTVVSAFAACQVESPTRLVLALAYSRATWMTDLEVPILRADQARARRGTLLDGLGPFTAERRGDNEIRFVPANNTVMGRPELPIVIRTIRDENVRVLRLIGGHADIAPNAVSPTLLPTLGTYQNLKLSTREGANVTYLLVQNDREPFRTANARRALSLAIDRQAIVTHLLNGYAKPAKWLLPESHWAAPADLPKLAYDPASAKLAFEHAAPVTLLTSPDRSRVMIARAIAQMLRDVGLETYVQPLDLGVMLTRLDAGDFTLAILQIPELTEPNVLSWFFHPKGIPGEGHDGRNRARYRNPRAAELFDAAASSFDQAVRAALYAELAHRMLDDMPVVPLWHEDQMTVTSARVQGFRPSAEGHWLSLATTTR